jgi:hypothetical protein
MAAYVIDEGLEDRMAGFYGSSSSHPPDVIRLFTACAGGPTKASVLADFVEVTAIMGYAAQTVDGADWTFAISTPSHNCLATATYLWLFTPGVGITIVGWYILNVASGKVQLAESFSVPVIIPPVGGSLEIDVEDTYEQCP